MTTRTVFSLLLVPALMSLLGGSSLVGAQACASTTPSASNSFGCVLSTTQLMSPQPEAITYDVTSNNLLVSGFNSGAVSAFTTTSIGLLTTTTPVSDSASPVTTFSVGGSTDLFHTIATTVDNNGYTFVLTTSARVYSFGPSPSYTCLEDSLTTPLLTTTAVGPGGAPMDLKSAIVDTVEYLFFAGGTGGIVNAYTVVIDAGTGTASASATSVGSTTLVTDPSCLAFDPTVPESGSLAVGSSSSLTITYFQVTYSAASVQFSPSTTLDLSAQLAATAATSSNSYILSLSIDKFGRVFTTVFASPVLYLVISNSDGSVPNGVINPVYTTPSNLYYSAFFAEKIGINPDGSLIYVPLTLGNLDTFEILALQGFAPAASGVKGDPQFIGLRGQEFQVHGVDGQIYNLVSSSNLQVNARFVFLAQGQCPIVIGLAGVNCWSHAGSYLGSIGMKHKTESNATHQLLITSGPFDQGFALIELNGRALRVGDSVAAGDLSLVIDSAYQATVITTEYVFTLFNSDLFINLAVSARVPLTHLKAHGLLGQSSQNKIYSSAIKFIEGDIEDYVIHVGDLFGVDFVYNQFKA